MADEKFYVTEEGLKDLKKEYDELVHTTRNEVIEDLKAARAQGDLSENADYDAARDKQAQVEARIKELEYMIKNASIISEKKGVKSVRLGSTVTILELDSNTKSTFTIVGSVEADPLNGKLSNASPLAAAILDKKVDAVATVEVDKPYQVKIIEIK